MNKIINSYKLCKPFKSCKPYLAVTCYLSLMFMMIFLISGCWDRLDPEDSSFILGMGFDYEQESELYEVTVQIADPTSTEEMMGDGGGGIDVSVISAKGRTPFEAVQNLRQYLPRQPFFSHNKIVIVTKELAERGLGGVYDFFAREREARLVSIPIILKGDKSITNLFRTEVPLEQTTAEALEREVLLNATERAIFPTRTLVDVLKVTKMRGREPLIGTIELGEQEEEDLIGEEEAVRSTIIVQGAGILKDDKLKGYFDQKEVKGWHWVQGKIVRATAVIKCPAHDEHLMTVEVLDSDSKINVSFDDNNRPVISLTIRADGKIQQQDCPTSYERIGKLTDSLDKRLAALIENEVKSAIEKTREKEVDALGLGNVIYRQKSQEWKQLEENWGRKLTSLKVHIDVDAKVRRTGLIQEPPFN